MTEPRSYDARGWTNRVANLEGESSAAPCGEITNPLQSFEYDYDGRGNRLSETLTRGTTSEVTKYDYDPDDLRLARRLSPSIRAPG